MCYLCPARKFLRILKIVIVVDKFSQGTSFKLLVHFPLLSPLFISLAGEQCLLVWGWDFLYRCCSSWIRISPAQWWITLETGELSIISFFIHSKCFWLVETTRIIHHNQLLFTKFGKKLRHIESMTSKVQPAADYWTVDRKKPETNLCYFCWPENGCE